LKIEKAHGKLHWPCAWRELAAAFFSDCKVYDDKMDKARVTAEKKMLT
jgi:hypothetical protein